MTTPKTPSERQRDYVASKRAAGLKELRNFWAFEADEKAIRAYAERLTKKRLKEAKK